MNNLVVFNLKSWLMISEFIKVFFLYSDLKFSSVFVLFCLSFGFWGLGGHWHQTPCVQRVMQADLWSCAWSWNVQINVGQNGHIWLDLHTTKNIYLGQKARTAACCLTSNFSYIQKITFCPLKDPHKVWGHWAKSGGDRWGLTGYV